MAPSSKKQKIDENESASCGEFVANDFDAESTISNNPDIVQQVLINDPMIELVDETNQQPFIFTNAHYIEVKLMKILEELGAPLYAFEIIMDWGFEAKQNGYDFQPTTKTYTSQIQQLTKMAHMEGIRPYTETVTLFKDNLEIPVVCFDFIEMFLSLLNDPELNQLENFVINPEDPFGKYKSPDGRLDEINSGAFYEKAYQTMCTEPNDFLCPLIFTTDKTTLSNNANLHAHPFMMSTALFKSAVSEPILEVVLLMTCFHIVTFVFSTRFAIDQSHGGLLAIFQWNEIIIQKLNMRRLLLLKSKHDSNKSVLRFSKASRWHRKSMHLIMSDLPSDPTQKPLI